MKIVLGMLCRSVFFTTIAIMKLSVRLSRKKQVWLSSMSLANDSSEGKWLRKIIEEEGLVNGISKEQLPHITQSLDMLTDMVDGLALCLSEEADLLSQWRAYADDGAGVSIGFKKQFLEGSVRKLYA